MSMLEKIKGMLRGHEDQYRQGFEKSGDFVDKKTDNKYRSQVDTAQEKLNEKFGTEGDTRPPQS
jgi:hypothetical protein